MSTSSVQRFLDFVSRSPSAFHAAQALCDALDAAGFVCLQEHEPWSVAPGSRCYVTRNRSAVVAFAVPEDGFSHFQIVSSHGDSPMFKLKPNAEDASAAGYVRLDVERYGGMIMSTWLDRPLSVAGRAVVRSEGKLVTRDMAFQVPMI